jgi:hypothetical protein
VRLVSDQNSLTTKAVPFRTILSGHHSPVFAQGNIGLGKTPMRVRLSDHSNDVSAIEGWVSIVASRDGCAQKGHSRALHKYAMDQH